MIQAKDYDGGRRLGRLALLLSVVSIVVGLAIVLYLVITGKPPLFFSTHTAPSRHELQNYENGQ